MSHYFRWLFRIKNLGCLRFLKIISQRSENSSHTLIKCGLEIKACEISYLLAIFIFSIFEDINFVFEFHEALILRGRVLFWKVRTRHTFYGQLNKILIRNKSWPLKLIKLYVNSFSKSSERSEGNCEPRI